MSLLGGTGVVLVVFMGGRGMVVMMAFLLVEVVAGFSRSFPIDLVRDSRRGWTVESESVRPLVMGDCDSLLDFSLLVRPVFGFSLVGLATDAA
jgi:hypothetical protein